jgi:hypothetical protein
MSIVKDWGPVLFAVVAVLLGMYHTGNKNSDGIDRLISNNEASFNKVYTLLKENRTEILENSKKLSKNQEDVAILDVKLAHLKTSITHTEDILSLEDGKQWVKIFELTEKLSSLNSKVDLQGHQLKTLTEKVDKSKGQG